MMEESVESVRVDKTMPQSPSPDTLPLTPPRSNPGTPPSKALPGNEDDAPLALIDARWPLPLSPHSPPPDDPINLVLTPLVSPARAESHRCSAGAELPTGLVPPPPSLRPPPAEDGPLIQALAGIGGQVLSTTLLYPLAVLKTRAQTAGVGAAVGAAAADTSLSGMVRDIIADDGVAGLYRGMGGEMVKESCNRAVYFYIYAFCKRKLLARAAAATAPDADADAVVTAPPPGPPPPPTLSVGMNMLAGM